MYRGWLPTAFAGALAASAVGRGESLQQGLLRTYASPGTVLILQKDNLLMYANGCPPPLNTFKNGTITQSRTNTIRSLIQQYDPTGRTAALPNCGEQTFGRGANLSSTQIDVQNGSVTFHLSTSPGVPVQYFGDLKFDLKKTNATLDEARATIAQAFAAQQNEVSDGPIAGCTACGAYILREAPDAMRLEINPNGTFFFQVYSGHRVSGHWTVNGGTTLILTDDSGRSPIGTYTIQGDRLYANGATLVRQAIDPTPPPFPSPVVQLALPAIFVNAKSPKDRLQLNADDTFALQLDGQAYSGTFNLNEKTLELVLPDGVKSTASVEGNQLTDGNGEKWTLQQVQSSASRPTSPEATRIDPSSTSPKPNYTLAQIDGDQYHLAYTDKAGNHDVIATKLNDKSYCSSNPPTTFLIQPDNTLIALPSDYAMTMKCQMKALQQYQNPK